ncbi:unnamed protein product [Ostreobium quekettii]|uniref:HYDIN/VesB/CFA65-like Ig-like domain-containing protein n=1 Tax=Ostreobium quekettii TaxID=121088 RepID=A0A8S1IZ04_9CHLO|nr:unnamed protein product [Ostreobium quekettii]
MSVDYVVEFRPESQEDYFYDIVVCTEREKYIVPVTAVGQRPALDFPDVIDFGQCPLKISATRSMLVTNVGGKSAKFDLFTDAPFSVDPRQGTLAPGESLRCSVEFNPRIAGAAGADLHIAYDYGETIFSQLTGFGHQIDVAALQEVVEVLPTYVTKMSQKSFKVMNRSDVIVAFSVRGARVPEDEASATDAKLMSLGGSLDTLEIAEECSTAEDGDMDAESILSDRQANASRIFSLETKRIRLEKMFFRDENFSIHPLEGAIPPGSQVEITVEFRPTFAKDYEKKVFVEVQGRKDRLPVTIKARGLGPEAVFSYDMLDVGDTFINTTHQYEVELQNRGKIDARFRLTPPHTEFGSKFNFHPSSGSLDAGEVCTIKVKLLSNLLGDFDETFHWDILSSSRPLLLQFKGRVVGPSFTINVSTLDYGVVSYGFRYSKEVTLENTSQIPVKFSWRLNEDDEASPEFQMVPQTGRVLPNGKQTTRVNLVSRRIEKYERELLLDIPDVGRGLAVIPLFAECAVPKIEIETDILDFGECFVRYEFKRSLKLLNPSNLPAKFEVMQQDAHSRNLAAFSARPDSGGVPAQGHQTLEFSLATSRLGRIQLPVRVQIVGSRNPPLEFAIEAKSVGPKVHVDVFKDEMEPGATASRSTGGGLSIDFGKVHVLEDHGVWISVHNTSLIPAEFKTFIEGKDSVFKIDRRSGVLEPQEKAKLKVTTNLDMDKKFKDTLHILVTEGADIDMQLQATGIGSTVVCKEIESGLVDFGNQFSGRSFSKNILVCNMDRRPVTLQWTNETAEAARKRATKTKKLGERPSSGSSKHSQADGPPEEEQIYYASPEKTTIGAKQTTVVTIEGITMTTGIIEERLVCRGGVTNAGKGNSKGSCSSSNIVFDVVAQADVAAPLLEFPDRELRFVYYYEKDVHPQIMRKDVAIRNVSKLPLTLFLRTQSPFQLSSDSLVLSPNEEKSLVATFDPSYRGDLESAVARSRVNVTCADTNYQKDGFELVGEVHRPNLKFETTRIDYGSVLTDTCRRVTLAVTNVSSLDVIYHWMFLEGDAERGTRLTGARVVFRSSLIRFNIEPDNISLGAQPYDRAIEREITLHNQGKVPFDFNVIKSHLTYGWMVESIPEKGRVGAGQRDTLKLKIKAGLPEKFQEKVYIEVAHFDPTPITFSVEGVYPYIYLSLPRHKTHSFSQYLEEAKKRLIQAGPKPNSSPKGARSNISRPSPPSKATRSPTAKERPPSASTIRSKVPTAVATSSSARMPKNPLYDLGYTKADWESEADRLQLHRDLLIRASKKEDKLMAAAMGCESPEMSVPPKEEAAQNDKNALNVDEKKQVSFQFNKHYLDSFGLSIDPEAILKLAEFDSVDMTLTMHTSKPQVTHGPLEATFPVEVKQGPAVMITVKAYIMTPDLKISSDALDFGMVQSGHCKIMTVQLTNPKHVPCEWCIKRPMEGNKAKDWDFFRCSPNEGTLEFSESINVKVRLRGLRFHGAAVARIRAVERHRSIS